VQTHKLEEGHEHESDQRVIREKEVQTHKLRISHKHKSDQRLIREKRYRLTG